MNLFSPNATPPSEEDSSGKEGRKRDDGGKFEKKEPQTPEEKEVKKEPEPEPPKKTDEEYKTEIETLSKELIQLRIFKTNRLKEIDDFEARMQAQRTKEDQKLKGFKEEKKSEGDQTVIPPLYKKMSFENLSETSKEMRKK